SCSSGGDVQSCGLFPLYKATHSKTDYLINQYSLTENFFAGEEYTFVIKGSVPQGQKFGVCQNGGSSNVGYATSVYGNYISLTFVHFHL
ncbi:hypothetical protein ACUOFC_35415, partial [Escherichia sp. TWPC-MK]